MKGLIALLLLCLGTAQASAAAVVGATTIKITGAPGVDYLQIAEVIATDYADVNLAPLATKTTSSVYGHPTPDYYGTHNLVDGVTSNPDDLYHSGGTGPSEFVLFTFATPQDLASLTLYGRTLLAQPRNIYNVEIRNSTNSLLFSGTMDARTNSPVTVNFDVVTGVPEPSTWAIMILGLGAVGRSMRSRKISYRTLHAA